MTQTGHHHRWECWIGDLQVRQEASECERIRQAMPVNGPS